MEQLRVSQALMSKKLTDENYMIDDTNTKKLPKITGVILAGGQSKRMGQDKASLKFKEFSLLERTLKTLHHKNSLINNTIISGRQGPLTSIEDKFSNCGPLCGIYSVMQSLFKKTDAILVVPVDMPLLTPALIGKLVQKALSQPSFDVFVYNKQIFPLFIRMNQHVMSSLQMRFKPHIRKKQHSIKHWISSLTTYKVTIDKKRSYVFTNVNTPEEWEQLTNKGNHER